MIQGKRMLQEPFFKKHYLFFSILGCVTIALIDVITIERYAFFLFYFPSLMLLGWYSKSKAGYLLPLFCAGGWLVARFYSSHPMVAPVVLWNFSVRWISFSFVLWITRQLRLRELKLAEAQKEISRLLELEKNISRHDPLTGAYNSRAFRERLRDERQRSIRFKHPLSLLYIDLDGFKKMNDLHGHQFGDELLKKTVICLNHVVRNIDLVARLGGDEFIVLLPETSAEGAAVCSDRILEAFKKEIIGDVTASIGAVSFKECPESEDEMIRIADHAMYRAKKAGKNQYALEQF